MSLNSHKKTWNLSQVAEGFLHSFRSAKQAHFQGFLYLLSYFFFKLFFQGIANNYAPKIENLNLSIWVESLSSNHLPIQCLSMALSLLLVWALLGVRRPFAIYSFFPKRHPMVAVEFFTMRFFKGFLGASLIVALSVFLGMQRIVLPEGGFWGLLSTFMQVLPSFFVLFAWIILFEIFRFFVWNSFRTKEQSSFLLQLLFIVFEANMIFECLKWPHIEDYGQWSGPFYYVFSCLISFISLSYFLKEKHFVFDSWKHHLSHVSLKLAFISTLSILYGQPILAFVKLGVFISAPGLWRPFNNLENSLGSHAAILVFINVLALSICSYSAIYKKLTKQN